MFSRFNRISIKYGVAFVAVVLSLVCIVAVDAMLVNSVKQRMLAFSGQFNVATSEVLNADRDLYQARMAEMAYLGTEPGSARASALREDFRENATQAHDRVEAFSELMSDHPDVVGVLDNFATRYDGWISATGRVFTLNDAGDTTAAAAELDEASLQRFESLRELYNLAGEAVKAKVETLRLDTQNRVRRQQTWVTGFAIAVCLVATAIALVGPHLMSRSIREVSERIREITEGDGDLRARIHSNRGDEIGELAERFNAFIRRMDDTLQAVRDSAQKVDTTSSDIARGSEELAARTEQSSANLHETSASMEEITITVNSTSDAARQASILVSTTTEVAREGRNAMRDVNSTMDDINDSANRIKDIVTLIDGIAFQTNILALNASVEAARAGEQGRGFAVVAQEVRTLAGRCSDASHEIRNLVETSVSSTRAGAELAVKAGHTMEQIVGSVEKVTHVISEISTGAQEQSLGIGQVNTAVAELDTMTQHNAAMVEESRSAAGLMHYQARQLIDLLAGFQLSGDVTDSASRPGETNPTRSLAVVADRTPGTLAEDMDRAA